MSITGPRTVGLQTIGLWTMGTSDNYAAENAAAEYARCRQWASLTIGLQRMGPRTIWPRMMIICNTYAVTIALPMMGQQMMRVANNGVVDNRATGGGHC